jgi:ferric-dicitrate binding protein FerR (iron transport regulator)
MLIAPPIRCTDSPTLEQVASEFNRYNNFQIQLERGGIRSKRLTGVFDANDPQSLLQFLRRDPQLTVESSGKSVVIRGTPHPALSPGRGRG